MGVGPRTDPLQMQRAHSVFFLKVTDVEWFLAQQMRPHPERTLQSIVLDLSRALTAALHHDLGAI